MAYSGLYQHFPGYTGPASPHGHSSPPAGPANNNNTSSCSPAKSEPGAGEGPSASGQPSHSPGGYKWSPASGTGGQGAADTGHRGGGSVTDILSPFQSYDQHHQVMIGSFLLLLYFNFKLIIINPRHRPRQLTTWITTCISRARAWATAILGPVHTTLSPPTTTTPSPTTSEQRRLNEE